MVNFANYGPNAWTNRLIFGAELNEARVGGDTYLGGEGVSEGGGSHVPKVRQLVWEVETR